MNSVKLLMSWDIKPGRDQDYFEFVVREWMPGMNKLGIETIGAWYTIYSRSETPQIVAEGLADDLLAMKRVLTNPEWQELNTKLLEYVNNYKHKVVRVNGEFQF